ncbi:DUF2125 domain-containing protein [Rhizobium sp. NFR03]|uniref:DUF2125 domain-containing protein n=1 Tax=Rhizobium sp. NFR03 TaxID=1566263 RepID=UPI0008BF7490|nr:DUF2125 domain-containing protein [Rhizobium sp. NFR03]SES34701.1 hypothetical protein SAMN03159406_03610 [Rhizobium sp. NFR03]
MTQTAPPAAGTRIKRLGIGIVIFLAVYSGIWFLAAHQIETRLASFLTSRSGSVSARCDGLTVRGFPFRIGLFCDSVKADDTKLGASGSAGALRSAAQVYWPGHAVIEMDGPAELRFSPGIATSMDWQAMKASIQATLSGLSRTSVVSERLTGTLVPTLGEDALGFATNHTELHLRQNAADLDAAVSITGLDLKPHNGESLLPLMNAAIDLTVKDRATVLDRGGLSRHALRNSTGEVRNLTIDLGNGMVTTANGPFTVDDQGLISGAFKVTMQDVQAWRTALAKAFPESENMLDNAANMLTALAAGGNDTTVTLNVRDGTAFLAFIPIGVLPQL